MVRNGTALTSGSTYIPGETLTVKISSLGGRYTFQASNAAFTPGLCGNTRPATVTSNAQLVMPTSGNVSVFAAYALQKGTLSISDTFVLYMPQPSASPSAQPTFEVTPAPSASPSNPTATPTASPTLAPTSVPKVDTSTYLSSDSHSRMVRLVTIILLGGIAIMSYLFVSSAFKTPSGVMSGLACFLALVTLAMVLSWGTDNSVPRKQDFISTSTSLFLGRPDWKANVFAWHPVLMTAGFFASQVFAVSAWSTIEHHTVAKVVHVMFQTTGLVCCFIGLRAVVKDKNANLENNLTTMHSWVGVMSLSCFTVNYIFGCGMALLTQLFPDSELRKNVDLRYFHKRVGVVALCLSAMGVVSGVTNHTGRSCQYVHELSGIDANPSLHYDSLPDACKLSNGLGVSAMLACILLVLAVTSRGEAFSLKPEARYETNDGRMRAMKPTTVAVAPL